MSKETISRVDAPDLLARLRRMNKLNERVRCRVRPCPTNIGMCEDHHEGITREFYVSLWSLEDGVPVWDYCLFDITNPATEER